MGIHTVRIQNFKSIRDSGELEIRPMNVLIGANGVGKSNFIGFFKLLNRIYERQLSFYVAQNGRADNFLHFGRKRSDFLGGEIIFEREQAVGKKYGFILRPNHTSDLIFSEEWSNYTHSDRPVAPPSSAESGHLFHQDDYLSECMRSFKIFHFHDTGFNSKIKQPSNSTDYAYLHEDGGNLAAFLYLLQEKHPAHFKMIVRTVQSIAPFFDRFFLQPDEINGQQIFLRWLEKGSEQMFTAHNLSDGTLRMMCLCTLLLQPNLPSTIIIDEPELGLHPFAIEKLAAMLKSASQQTQVIVSTQSVNLLNHFEAEDVIVVERQDNQSVFHRLDSDELAEWLEEYSLSDLWDKNVLGGRP